MIFCIFLQNYLKIVIFCQFLVIFTKYKKYPKIAFFALFWGFWDPDTNFCLISGYFGTKFGLKISCLAQIPWVAIQEMAILLIMQKNAQFFPWCKFPTFLFAHPRGPPFWPGAGKIAFFGIFCYFCSF